MDSAGTPGRVESRPSDPPPANDLSKPPQTPVRNAKSDVPKPPVNAGNGSSVQENKGHEGASPGPTLPPAKLLGEGADSVGNGTGHGSTLPTRWRIPQALL